MKTGKILFSLAPGSSRFTSPPNFGLPWPHSWSLLHLLSFWFVRLVFPIACTVKELRIWGCFAQSFPLQNVVCDDYCQL